MLETSARLLRLLSLLQTQREWTGAELAERLEVTPRTVRRDVGRLRTLGYPVHSTTGTAGGYRLGAGARLPPLLLDDDEAVAVGVGLRTAAAGGAVRGIEESSVRALAKLEQVLPHRLRRRMGAVAAFTDPIGGHRGPTVAVDTITELVAACRDHRRIRFAYQGHDGTSSRRDVEPYRLVYSGRRWYLAAWDTDRADWRTFRVDRVVLAPPHGPRFEPREPPTDDWGAYVSEGISTSVYPERATVLLRVPIERAAERVTPATGVLEPVDERSCLLRTGANSLQELVFHLLALGFDFEVRSPPALVRHVEVLAERLARAASEGRSLRGGS
ncbi:WYL domain-containing protein [Streptomyces sp. TRM43335]|uniref:WYL domain-containing protein n=1 Tax=Streptomyces taklimakanensis TaxID=2569853 RepID=A0A6G2B8J0_9ACTN|nr:YafY family protein [Streptomyces taklimakanensis]MTE18389.1 WYL domain-containing protein [Streptomyces taklimakanensis]